MKICYISAARIPTERPHGYGIAKMCESFAKLGHEVTLLSPGKSSWMGKDIFEYYGLDRDFTHVRAASLDLLMSEHGGGRIGYWADFLSFMFIVLLRHGSLLRSFDLLYVRDPYIALFTPAKKTILELHTLPAPSFLMRRVLRRVRRLSAISHGLAEDTRVFSGRTDIVVIPDAVDIRRFELLPRASTARAELGLPASGPIALYTGNFYAWKGVDTLADAATYLSDAAIVLVGGTDEQDYQRIAAKAASITNLIVRRFESPARMPIYLAAADVLVIPNSKGTAISERHTSPLKLFEYMAVGKPIVASDLPSLREILDEDTAIFFKPDDPEDLARAAHAALRPEAFRIGVETRERVKIYSWESRARAAIEGI